MPNHRHHTKRRKHIPAEAEEEVDDLLIASMAVASTWSPPANGEKCGSSSSAASDGSSDESGSSDEDDPDVEDEAEISLDDDIDEPVKATSSSPVKLPENHETNNVEPTSAPFEQKQQEESDDSDSDIDLTEDLADMQDEDEDGNDIPKTKSSMNNSKPIYQGPKTEHEMDPYQCPTLEMEKLNFLGGGIDETVKKQLRVSGVIHSYLVEQRTIVVDSSLPVSLQNQNNSMEPLDEGSVMAILLTNSGEVAALKEASKVEILGKVVEVFGPVQKPLYVVRLPDPPQVQMKESPIENKQSVDHVMNASEESCPPCRKEGDDTEMSTGENNLCKNDTGGHGETNTKGTEENQTAPVSQVKVSKTNINEKATIHEATSEKRKLPEMKAEDDSWSPTGKLSTILRNTPNALVYSIVDHSTMINKEQIIKISGKGCDASNMFDEEISPNEQQDFSDDEDERNAKKGNRKPQVQNHNHSERSGNFTKRGGGRGRGRGRGRGSNNFSNNPPPQQPFYPIQPIQQQAYFNPNIPQMHQSYQYGYQPMGQMMQYPQGYNYGIPPPPPPPPPPRQNNLQYSQQQQNNGVPQQQAPSSSQGDTVYYDYSGS